MSVSHLLRERAPITEEGWSRLDDEARERVVPALAARKLIDFAGPRGWKYSATNLGRRSAYRVRRRESRPRSVA